jgi:hypothetical protein
MKIVKYVQDNKPLHSMLMFHDVNKLGIPDELQGKINSVPVLLTKSDQKILVGQEIMAWFESVLPSDFVGADGGWGASLTDPEGGGDGGMFELDSYGVSLSPPMTKEMQSRIDQSVSDAYQSRQGS